MTGIHPSAIIEPGAELGERVTVGPYCHIGADVRLGDDVRLDAHVVIVGHTSLGARTRVFPFASLGHRPQDLKYRGEPSRLVVGADNQVREHVTMHPGTGGGGLLTRVGDGCLFMASTHVAHDCKLGDHVILANNATLGGHVRIGDYAYLGGLCAVHQFVRIGRYAMIGGMSGVENDVIPYGSVIGNRAYLCGLNIVGMRRRGFSREEVHDLRNAYRLLFAPEGTFAERMEDVAAQYGHQPRIMEIVDFVRAASARSLSHPKAGRNGAV